MPRGVPGSGAAAKKKPGRKPGWSKKGVKVVGGKNTLIADMMMMGQQLINRAMIELRKDGDE